MLTTGNKAVTIIAPVWIEHSGRNTGFTVAHVGGATTLIIDHLPTALVRRLVVAILQSSAGGTLIIRKWYAGGTLFVDETSAVVLASPLGNIIFSDTLMETCQILYQNALATTVTVTEIGRS